MNTFRFIDLFCGGGGSITGAINALNDAGVTYEGRGFNHWELAIKTIQANHPEVVPDFARACTPIEAVVPDGDEGFWKPAVREGRASLETVLADIGRTVTEDRAL